MSSAPSADAIARDARWLPQALDPNGEIVRLIDMSPDAYREASFLDDRILQAPVNAVTLPFAEVAAAVPGEARGDARWIFHVGHVGSTLVSRLLGELEGVLALREPRILRDLAAMPEVRRCELVPPIRKLLSRTFAPGDAALVKATSFVSEIAPELVPPDGRALFVYADARTYVATILAGPNSLKELHALGDTRAQRMIERVRDLPPARNPAQLAAAAWACEMTALEAAADAMPDRSLRWANFNSMLEDMEAALAQFAGFFGFDAPAERLREIAQGPLMSRYSKALEYEYSPSLRRQLIEQEFTLHGAEIDDALALLERSAQESPLLARALARP